MRIPYPESLSHPGASISRAVFLKACRASAMVRPGLPESINAAMAAAWGAEAEVPQNGKKPGVAVFTQSAAVISGLARTMPPVALRLPGVMAVPLA